ncbi:MAG: efflux RND transporter periplasmic adaptor subunit [Syntrophomonadaceae bacterium]
MKNKKLLWIVGASVLLILISAFYYVSSAQSVATVKIQKGVLTNSISETGYVKTVDQYDVEAQNYGLVEEVMVATGQQVSSGTVLMRLINPDLDAETEQTQAQLALARGELSQAELTMSGYEIESSQAQTAFDRQKSLYEMGAVSQADYEEARDRLQKAVQQVELQGQYMGQVQNKIAIYSDLTGSLQSKRSSLTIKSPIDGAVLDLPGKEGMYITPGSLLAQIGTTSQLEIQADLLSDDLGDVQVGQPVSVTATVLGQEVLSGVVNEIKPRAFAKISALGVEQRRVPVMIKLNSGSKLKPGYEVRVSIETARRDGVLLVPREALKSTGDGRYQIMKINNNRVVYQDIELGLKGKEYVEATSGIKEGDLIIKDGGQTLAEKARVKVQ